MRRKRTDEIRTEEEDRTYSVPRKHGRTQANATKKGWEEDDRDDDDEFMNDD
jgi:hypothetical protein